MQPGLSGQEPLLRVAVPEPGTETSRTFTRPLPAHYAGSAPRIGKADRRTCENQTIQ